MQIIGIHGRSGAGTTAAAGVLAGVLADGGHTAKVDSVILRLRVIAREEGRLDKAAHRGWYQQAADAIRKDSPNYFLNDLLVRNNLDAELWPHFSDNWTPADFLIIHDVRLPREAAFCRQRGVVIHMQGTHCALSGPEAEHETEAEAATLSFEPDYTLPWLPTREQLEDAVRAMVAAGGHVKKE